MGKLQAPSDRLLIIIIIFLFILFSVEYLCDILSFMQCHSSRIAKSITQLRIHMKKLLDSASLIG